MAAHVQKAVAGAMQPKMPQAQRPVAAHVQAALAGGGTAQARVPGGGRVIQPSSSSKTPEQNYNNLGCYRPAYLDTVEREFLKNGYRQQDLRGAILNGLAAWDDDIPGHCSRNSKSQVEQQGTGPKCKEARDFLLDWVQRNPGSHGDQSSNVTNSRRDHVSPKEVSRKRREKKVKKKTEKMESYKQEQREQCHHPNVQFGWCLSCGQEVG